MPLYDYVCRSCGRAYEALVTRHGDPAPACPVCGMSDVERTFSVFSVGRSGGAPSPGPCGSTDCACRVPSD